MNEEIAFTFDGKIASQHRMDFYEAARFQYSASRLLVKLDYFRKNGEFPKKITYKNNTDIFILPSKKGSFGLEVIAPLATMMAPMLLELPISALFSYVVDRIFGSENDDAMREALATNRELVQVFDNTIAGRDDSMNRVLDMLQQSMDRGQELSNEVINLQARLISDQERRLQLNENKEIFRKISEEKEAELITMAAPLLKEMNVPLRKSSSSPQVRTKIGSKYTNIIIADKNMADSVNIAVVDKQKTIIDINIVQFNKQTGWGKFENPEWEGQPSFSVPGDILDDFKETIVNSMNADLVSVECLFVRSPAGIPQRIIMTDLWPAKD